MYRSDLRPLTVYLDFEIDGATHVDLVIKTIGLHIEIPCKRH